MICMIPRGRLEPHPDNPRKDLGDLTELASSIAKQGILQNLTVVPHPEKEDKYRIVIGHRRFAASGLLKMAKFDELPCVVDMDMTYPEQIAVMMSENIQRNDLTIAERIGGVQMMMDLGMTAQDVAKNTGLSQSTAYKYAKICKKLDKQEIKKAEQRGATLFQFEEIAGIEDEALRINAMNAVGTNNYQSAMWEVKNAKMRGIWKPMMLIALQEIGAEQIEENDWRVHSYEFDMRYVNEHDIEQIPKLSKKKKFVYKVTDKLITVYSLKENLYDNERERKRQEEQERARTRIRCEEEAVSRFKNMQMEFFRKEFTENGKESDAERFALWVLTRTEYTRSARRNGCLDVALGGVEEIDNMGNLIVDNVTIRGIPYRTLRHAMVLAAYDRISYVKWSFFEMYSGKLKKEDDPVAVLVRELYEHLDALGYPVSDEERAWLNGTHACFEGVKP